MAVSRTNFCLSLIFSLFLHRGNATISNENSSDFAADDEFFAGENEREFYRGNSSSAVSRIFKIAKNRGKIVERNETVSSGSLENNRLVDLLKIYDIGLVEKNGFDEIRQLTQGCKRNMKLFLEALDRYELWALKVLDASGRYTNGFFWGNNYWAGSESLCNNIGLRRRHYSSNGIASQENSTLTDKEAPFAMGFFKIKAELKLPKQLEAKKTILIGVCAPYTCTNQDIRNILNHSLPSERNKTRANVTIIDIRTPHNSYCFWKDKTFWILFGVSITTAILLAVGTAYDILRKKDYEKEYQISLPLIKNYFSNKSAKVGSDRMITSKSGSHHGLNASEKLDDNSNAVDTTEQSSTLSDLYSEIWPKALLSFSLKKNIKTICDNTVNVDTIPTIHGLKAISMAWVILGHTCIVIFKYSDNMEVRTRVEKEFFFQTVRNATFSVDTFFFISGLLVSFLYFRTTAKIDVDSITGMKGIRSNILQFVGLVAYRYGRLTAPYLFVLGIVQVSMNYFHQNSVFDTPALDHVNCPNYWWRNALYINTLYPANEMCMLWSWYLSDDTQFYILGLILLILAVPHIKIAASLLLFFLFSSWFTTAYIAYTNRHLPSQDDPLALFDEIYDKPWTRLGPYLIGMAVGWILFKTNCKIRMNKLVLVTGWILSMLVMLTLIYGLYGAKLDLVTSSAYSSLSHSTWAVGLAWIVIACSTGHGGFINTILSSSIFYPFSRVTFCAYLVHPLVIRYMIINLDSPMHINKELTVFLFFGQTASSYLLSFIISLAFEAPVVSLLRIVSPTKSGSSES